MGSERSQEPTSSGFAGGLEAWLARLGNLRNVVRQELVTRQLRRHLPDAPGPPLRVLDVGAGQGTQALRLAAAGHEVTALEPDPRMRAAFEAAADTLPPEVRRRVELRPGEIGTLAREAGAAAYDLVLCHGVLMYLPDSRQAIRALAACMAAGGLLSVVTRNGDALAWRPALRHDWAGALAMLDEVGAARREGRDARYGNEIGVQARADTVVSLVAACEDGGLVLEAWYGVRVASDDVPVDEPAPPPAELARLLAVEERLGSTDPYRRLGTLVHVLARRGSRP